MVQKALDKKAPSPNEYQSALDNAAEKIAAYSAARTALACERFKNFWGEEVRKGHCFPRKIGKKPCQERIAEIVREYGGFHVVSEADVENKFSTLLPQFKPGGSRFADYLCYFAGKDLLYAMRDNLRGVGFEPSPNSNYSPEEVFLERIVTRIEQKPDNVWEWLPEWQNLRRLIEETDFSTVSGGR
ncbi:hypothetical protein LKK83_19720 [Phormidium sp. CCY1219]|nr:hypothetical protein [Phormidium sp. CCY1219]